MWHPVEITAEPSPVTVKSFVESANERNLAVQFLAGEGGKNQEIAEPLPYRPGLALSGFFEYFSKNRIQVIGLTEYTYLKHLPQEMRKQHIAALFEHGIPCLVIARALQAFPEMIELAERYQTPLLQSAMETKDFIHQATFALEILQAPRRKVHGTMMEVDGVGVFLEGDAGVGKSETALGLIMHGHALVADDLTTLRRDANGDVIGSASKVTQNYMEIRGLGIIDVPAIFGLASVRGEKRLDLVITLLRQSPELDELDRTGIEEMTRNVLGVPIPQRVISVAPGRDLVNLVMTAARQYKQSIIGVSAVQALDERIKRFHCLPRG